ncbi:MAG: hypothetical protein R2695_21300 [Acidimicrobiales bacterium]
MVLRRRRRVRRQPPHFTYSRWDGTQTGFDVDADHLFDELADDLLYHGDVNNALRQMMQGGMRDRDGRQMQGIREMLDRLRERRREILDNHDLGGVFDDIADALREVVEEERRALSDMVEQADRSGDERRRELAHDSSTMKNMELDMLPPDLAGQVKGLQNYEFESAEAQQKFEELMDKLREQVMQRQLDQMAEGVSNMSPEDLQRMKDMLAELNHMLEQRANGEDPDFDGFMDRFGDFFPENPQSLDELLEVMARRMAQAQQMMNSMTPEQRQQLQALSDQLMEDMDLQWQMNQLADNLREQFPGMGVGSVLRLPGRRPARHARGDGHDERAGRHRPARQPAAGGDEPGRPGRGRPRSRRAAGRGVGRESRADGRARPDARGGRPHREPGGPLRADAAGDPQDRQWGARGALQEDVGRHDGQARAASGRAGPRASSRRSPTSTATRSISTSSRRCATPWAGRGAVRPSGCIPTTSRSSAPSSRCARPRC